MAILISADQGPSSSRADETDKERRQTWGSSEASWKVGFFASASSMNV